MKSSFIVLIIIYCVKRFPLIIFFCINNIRCNLICSKTLFDRCQGSFVPWNNGFLNPLSLYSLNSYKFGKQQYTGNMNLCRGTKHFGNSDNILSDLELYF